MAYQHTVVRNRLVSVLQGRFERLAVHAPYADVRVHRAGRDQFVILGELQGSVAVGNDFSYVSSVYQGEDAYLPRVL